jgi:hypothetical protein
MVNILINYDAQIDDKALNEAKQSGNRNIYEMLLKKKQSKKKEVKK